MTRIKTSRFKGVSKFRDKWRARIGRNTIGIYETELEAAQAYNKFSKNQLSDKQICTQCLEEKQIEEFYRDGRKVLGVSSICKTCHGINVRICNRFRRLGLIKNKESRKLILSAVLLDKINNKKITPTYARKIWNDKQDALNTV